MILFVTDGAEAIYLSLALKSAAENKPLAELLLAFVEKEKIPGLLDDINGFIRSKLRHPVLSLALEEMDELLSAREHETRRELK